MTQRRDKERTAQMNDIRSLDEQMRSVGIFRHDPITPSFFGVPSAVTISIGTLAIVYWEIRLEAEKDDCRYQI